MSFLFVFSEIGLDPFMFCTCPSQIPFILYSSLQLLLGSLRETNGPLGSSKGIYVINDTCSMKKDTTHLSEGHCFVF